MNMLNQGPDPVILGIIVAAVVILILTTWLDSKYRNPRLRCPDGEPGPLRFRASENDTTYPQVIAITGYAGAGKDSVAEAYASRLTRLGFQCEIIHFADPIKKIMDRLFGWDQTGYPGGDKNKVDVRWGISPRKAYQTFGTDWAHTHVSPNLWINLTAVRVKRNLALGKITLIADLRFLSESDWLASLHPSVRTRAIGVIREGAEGSTHSHISETQIPELLGRSNTVFHNEGSFSDIHNFAANDMLQLEILDRVANKCKTA